VVELKTAHNLNLSSLTNELRRLQERFNVATVDLEQKSSHLADTILVNHKLLGDGKARLPGLNDEELESLRQVRLPYVADSGLNVNHFTSIRSSRSLPSQSCSVGSGSRKKRVQTCKRYCLEHFLSRLQLFLKFAFKFHATVEFIVLSSVAILVSTCFSNLLSFRVFRTDDFTRRQPSLFSRTSLARMLSYLLRGMTSPADYRAITLSYRGGKMYRNRG